MNAETWVNNKVSKFLFVANVTSEFRGIFLLTNFPICCVKVIEVCGEANDFDTVFNFVIALEVCKSEATIETINSLKDLDNKKTFAQVDFEAFSKQIEFEFYFLHKKS